MNVEELLSRLDRVRQSGPSSWTARCPGHEDRSPSLSVRQTDGGVILMHCFGGCDPSEICGAIGIELSDLFPPKPQADGVKPKLPPIPAADVLAALGSEIAVVYMLSGDVGRGKLWSEHERWRFELAMRRIQQGVAESKRYG